MKPSSNSAVVSLLYYSRGDCFSPYSVFSRRTRPSILLLLGGLKIILCFSKLQRNAVMTSIYSISRLRYATRVKNNLTIAILATGAKISL